jgi:hypothetical protein
LIKVDLNSDHITIDLRVHLVKSDFGKLRVHEGTSDALLHPASYPMEDEYLSGWEEDILAGYIERGESVKDA